MLLEKRIMSATSRHSIYTVPQDYPIAPFAVAQKTNEVEAKREKEWYKNQASRFENSALSSCALPTVKSPVPKAHGQSREINGDVPTGAGLARVKCFSVA